MFVLLGQNVCTFVCPKIDFPMKGTVTTAIILETRKKRKDGRCPVKLRVTWRRESKYYVCRYDPEDRKSDLLWTPGEAIAMTEEEYRRTIETERPREQYKPQRLYLNKLESTARKVIISLGARFTFESFDRKFFGAGEAENNIILGLQEKAKVLRSEGRISNAIIHDFAGHSLENFLNVPYLPFENLTPELLTRYEKWMLSNGNSLTTVGMYLRAVRAVYRQAVRDGIFDQDVYPFGEGGYKIPVGWNVKKALTQKQVGMIANYATVNKSPVQRYRDYWLFSYLCNGINVKDMARLKYSNINGDTITLIRAKTARETRTTPHPIVIIITRQLGKIIDRWGQKPAFPDEYLFPILRPDMTPQQEYNAIYQVTKSINKVMKEIASDLEIPGKVTTYTARHSFATVLKRSGASTEFISESLGHTSTKTTAAYLASFENDVKRQWAEKLADF